LEAEISSTMRAAVYRGRGDLRVEGVPVPTIGPGEALVHVDACGVCPTDIKKIEQGVLEPPRIFGHEIAGRVFRLGAGVKHFQEGQRVVVHHHIPCRACAFCSEGAYAQCERYKLNGTTAGFEPSGGGFAEYLRAMDWIVSDGMIPIPDGVRAEEAVFVEPVNTCLKAIRKAGVEKGQTVLVVGQGPIGSLLMQLARWSGAETIVTDTLEDRLVVSRELGAGAALLAGEGVVAEILRLTMGRGVDRALVAAVGQRALRQAIDATRPAGRILVFAATARGETAEVDFGALAMAEKDLVTSYSASIDVQDLAADLVFGREVRVAELISHRFPLERAPEALETAAHPRSGVLKVVVEMPGHS
jgi:L-iditol 2-dehydrogenase